jgi:hypothetical protein
VEVKYPKTSTKEAVMKFIRTFALVLLTAIVLAGCAFTVTRTGKGTFQVESSMTQAQIQAAIQEALKDPNVQSLTASLQDGYILVSGVHTRTDGSGSDVMTFRLDLGVSNGTLTAVVSNVKVDNFTVGQDVIASWNQRLADGLVKVGQNTPHSTLQSVSVTSQAVTFVWVVTR